MLLYSEKSQDFFKEHNFIRPAFYFGQSSEEKVMTENIINFNDKVTDKIFQLYKKENELFMQIKQ